MHTTFDLVPCGAQFTFNGAAYIKIIPVALLFSGQTVNALAPNGVLTYFGDTYVVSIDERDHV